MIDIKKKKKHKKKTKRKHEDDSSKSSDSDEPKNKISKLSTCSNMKKKNYNKNNGSEQQNMNESENFEKLMIKKNSELENIFEKEPDSSQLPPISKKIQDESEEQLISKVLGLYCFLKKFEIYFWLKYIFFTYRKTKARISRKNINKRS